MLGLTGRTLEEVLELVAKEVEVNSITAVFVTDLLDFDPFRKRRLRFEYFPDRGKWYRFAPDLDWDLYERHRYALLRDKWKPRLLIWFGRQPPPECVAIINPTTARPHRLFSPSNNDRIL